MVFSVVAEELLAAVAHTLQVQVAVTSDRLAIIHLLGLPERLFTTDFQSARIQTIPRWQVRMSKLSLSCCSMADDVSGSLTHVAAC